MKNTPWIVCDFADGKTGKCLRCGEDLQINLPQHLEVFAAALKAFCKVHEDCEEAP